MSPSELSLIRRCAVESKYSVEDLTAAWARMEKRRKEREGERKILRVMIDGSTEVVCGHSEI